MNDLKVKFYASKIMNALKIGKQIELISNSEISLDIKTAYTIAAEIESFRVSKGEKLAGLKIGFTNKNIWKQYNASAPIVGAMYDTTVFPLSDNFSISRFLEPRIEPEIIFKIKKRPTAEMSDNDLMGCISSVAHGFEIVHCVFKNWNFQTADTIAAFGLHGALIHGPFNEISSQDITEWTKNLSNFDLTLFLNGREVEKGKASNVLGSGPLKALRYILRNNLGSGHKVDLKPGDLVTTGTLTGAYPILADQSWSTEISGIKLQGLRVKFKW